MENIGQKMTVSSVRPPYIAALIDTYQNERQL